MRILDSTVRIIKNSRDQDTIEVTIKTKLGLFTTSAPDGASKGENEVQTFPKEGVGMAVQFLSPLLFKLQNNYAHFRDFSDLKIIEDEFRKVDKTKNLSLTGGNTLYAAEASILKAIARSHQEKELWKALYDESFPEHPINIPPYVSKEKLPKPNMPMQLGNCVGGGKHTKETEKPDFQEFLILPKTNTFRECFNINQKVYSEVKNLLKKKDKKFQGKLTDEKAFISYLSNEEILAILKEIQDKMQKKGKGFGLGLDIAASSFYDKKTKKYFYTNFNGQPKKLNAKEQLDYIFNLIKTYNLAYVEDPFDESDFLSFSKLLAKVKKAKLDTLIVGDDLTCTNPTLLKKAISKKSINAVIIKPNQIGSLIETKKALDLAKNNNIVPIISNRSGETEDDTIAQLAVGWQIPIIKISIQGKERLAKTKKLLDIENKIKKFY